ncbi:MAG: cytochrome c oxidase subunit II [Flavobacteriia bacterium]|nr:cytochrome c oxidase subunit II [Flavobacteriia bacterium]
MGKLIAIIVIVLGVVALAQLVRVYELSSKLRNKGENEVDSKDNRLNGRLMLGFMAFFYIGFIYLMLNYGWTGRGVAATVHGRELDWLLDINFVIITIVFFLTNTLLFVFTYKYTRKPGVPAFYYPHNNKLEMLWTVVPASVLAVIIILGLKTWNNVTDKANSEAKVIELFSKQFDWTARYSGEDNKLGHFDYKLTTANNELALLTSNTIDSAIFEMEDGLSGIKALEAKLNDKKIMLVPEDREKMVVDLDRKERLIRLLYQMKARHNKSVDAAAWDDIIQKDTLYLCENQEYELNFRAKDVIHSAHFPHFRVQMNTVPGMTTRFKFTPDITTEKMRELKQNDKFNYVLLCNKICGGAHYKMKMIVVVLPKNEYNAWMNSKMATSTFKHKYFPVAAPVAAPVTPVTDSTAVPAV